MTSSPSRMTAGLYVWTDNPDQHAFWRSCGIELLQFCDLGWHRRHDLLDDYYAQMAAGVDSAQRSGFRVYVILFANIVQWEGPEEMEPTGVGVKFHPQDARALRQRLQALERTVRALRKADGFTFFAGDPGGVPASLDGAPTDHHDWIRMAVAVRQLVREHAPAAAYHVNPWAVSMWGQPELSALESPFWRRETEMHRAIIWNYELMDAHTGIELPCHEHYRPLVLRLYEKDRVRAAPWPDAHAIGALRQARCPAVWAWPYFLLEEADDGDPAADETRGQMGAETRMIHRFVRWAQRSGFDAVIGNWSYAAHRAEALNTYAFGRFCVDPSLTPEDVLRAWSRRIVSADSTAEMEQVLRFIENSSPVARQLPRRWRVRALACRLKTPRAALDALDKVHPFAEDTGLAEPATAYLERVRQRLKYLERVS